MKEKWKRREKKYRKRRHGMKITGRSVFLSVEQIIKRAEKIEKKRSRKR